MVVVSWAGALTRHVYAHLVDTPLRVEEHLSLELLVLQPVHEIDVHKILIIFLGRTLFATDRLFRRDLLYLTDVGRSRLVFIVMN